MINTILIITVPALVCLALCVDVAALLALIRRTGGRR
jgi:hypothetical protein